MVEMILIEHAVKLLVYCPDCLLLTDQYTIRAACRVVGLGTESGGRYI